MSPDAKRIIPEGIEVYATPVLQPTTPVAHLRTGLAIFAYLPMNPCRLPQPLPVDLLFLTDGSGESALTPITGGATLQLTHGGGHYHMDHHAGHTTYRASSHGELGAMADAIAKISAHLLAHLPHVVRVWFVVDATVDTHLLLRIAGQPLDKATATSLGTQALLLWKALRSLPPYIQLHIVKQGSQRHQYGLAKSTSRQYTPGELIVATVTYLSRRYGVLRCLRLSLPLGGTLGVHRTSWRIPSPRHACMFLVLGFRGALVSHAPRRVPKQPFLAGRSSGVLSRAPLLSPSVLPGLGVCPPLVELGGFVAVCLSLTPPPFFLVCAVCLFSFFFPGRGLPVPPSAFPALVHALVGIRCG